MAIPTVESLLLPVLKFLSNGEPHSLKEVTSFLANELNLSEVELTELQPSGRQTKFEKRVGWAKYHLQKADLIEGNPRSPFRITDRGLRLLKDNPDHIPFVILDQYNG